MITSYFSPPKVVCRRNIACLFYMMMWFTPILSQQLSSGDGIRNTLIPPGNCHAENVECAAYLTWDIPDSSNNPPPGLMGYYVYRNGNLLDIISDPDTTWSYDFGDPDTIIYSVTAWYDLTPYGYPGQFGESDACIMDTIVLDCYIWLPFLEEWNSGNFGYYDWRLIPDQGNWMITINNGNPVPAAGFNGLPAQSSYDFTLLSDIMWGISYSCADFFLSFDYKLEDIAASGKEHLEAGVMINDTAYPRIVLSNTGSNDWTRIDLDIDQVAEHGFAVYFRAFGDNSSDITDWLIDNITVWVVCKDVTNLGYSLNGDIVNLTWDHPCDTALAERSPLAGYFIYRTDHTGLPPFLRLNNEPITVKHYTDTLPSIGENDQYRYQVTAVFGYPGCESPGDTLLVIPASGINNPDNGSITLSPNPGHGLFTLKMSETAESFEVCNIQGGTILQESVPNEQDVITIDLSGYPNDIYFLKVKTVRKTYVSKIIKI